MPSARLTPDPAALQNPYRQVLASTASHVPWASGIVAAAVLAGVTGLAGSAHADPGDAGAFDILDDTDVQFGITDGDGLDLLHSGGTGRDGGGDGLDDLFTDPDADLAFGTVQLGTTGLATGTGDLGHGVTGEFTRDQPVGPAESPFTDIDLPAPGTDPVRSSTMGLDPLSSEHVGSIDDSVEDVVEPDHHPTGSAREVVGASVAVPANQLPRATTVPSGPPAGSVDVPDGGANADPDPGADAGGGDGRDGSPPRTTAGAAPDPDDPPDRGFEPDDQPVEPDVRTDGIPLADSVDRPTGVRAPRTARPDITAGPSDADQGGVEDDAETASLPNWIEQSGLPPNAFNGNVLDPRTGQVYAGGETGFMLVEPDFDRDVIAAHTGSRTIPSGLAPMDADEQRRWGELFGTGDLSMLDPDYLEGWRSTEAARGNEFESGRLMWNELPLFTTEDPGAATLELLDAHTDLEELMERARTGRSDDAEDYNYSFSSNEVARQAELATLQGRMPTAQPMDTITMAACQIDLLACTGEITPEAAAAARARIDGAAAVYDRGIELARTLVPDSRFGSRYPEVNDLIGTVSRLFGDNSVADAAATRVVPEVHPNRDGSSSYGRAPLPGILPDELTHLQIHPHEYRALLGDTISPRELANLEGAVQSYMRGAQTLGYDSGGSGGPNVLPHADRRARGLALLEESLTRYRTISRAEGFDSPDAVAAFGDASDLAAELRTAMLGEPPVGATPRTFELDDPVPGDLWNRAEVEALMALWQAGGGGRSFDTFGLDTLGSSRIDEGNVPRQFVFSTHRPPTGLEDLEDLQDLEEIEAGGSAAVSRVSAGSTRVPNPQTGLQVPTVPSAGGDEQGADPQETPGGQTSPDPAEGTGSPPDGVTVGGNLGRPVSRDEAVQAMFPGGDPNRADPPTALEESLTPRPPERTEFDPNSLNQPGEPVVIPELSGTPTRDPELEDILYPNGLAGPRETFPAGVMPSTGQQVEPESGQVRTPVLRPDSRFPLCGSGVPDGCIDAGSLRDGNGDGVADNAGTLRDGLVGQGFVGQGFVGQRFVGEGIVGSGAAPSSSRSSSGGSVESSPTLTSRPAPQPTSRPAAQPTSRPTPQPVRTPASSPEPTWQDRAAQVGEAVFNVITAPHPLDPVRGSLRGVWQYLPGLPAAGSGERQFAP